ncbi:MAG TPA: hypothetical protein VN924_22455 [Bryobacteraceae bacterium]|nr:hypothetical protein [Bryobacteraceae bacterium]
MEGCQSWPQPVFSRLWPARRFFPCGGAVGKRVRFGVQSEFQDLRIVGVRDARPVDLRHPNGHVVYVPSQQHPQYGEEGNLLVRAKHAAALAGTLHNEIRSLDREYVLETKTIEQTSDRALVAERAVAILSAAFAGAALLLAGYLPARRALKLDPTTALRCD